MLVIVNLVAFAANLGPPDLLDLPLELELECMLPLSHRSAESVGVAVLSSELEPVFGSERIDGNR